MFAKKGETPNFLRLKNLERKKFKEDSWVPATAF